MYHYRNILTDAAKLAVPTDLERKGDNDDGLMSQMKATLDNFVADNLVSLAGLKKDLQTERKEREDLEIRMQRLGMKSSTTISNTDAEAEHKALSAFVRSGDDSELKALSESSDPDGGYMVLSVMSTGMTKKIFDQSAIARLASRETITLGDAWEEIVDFNEAGATWVGENSSRPTTTSPQIGKIRIPVQEIYALLPVTQRLLDDSQYDVGSWVEDKIGDKFGRTEGAAFVNGDGVVKPRGFLTYSIVITSDATRAFGDLQYIKTGAAANFVAGVNQADCLVDMVYALRAPYKQGDGVAWVMNSTTAGAVRKFKDTTGQFIWQNSLQVGAPPMLLGYPVELDENMPDLGANNFPIAFGNWNLAYKIVDKKGIRMLQDPYTSKPNVLFYAYRRTGGGLSNSEAIKVLKCEA